MLPALQVIHQRPFSSVSDLFAGRNGAKHIRTKCSCSSQRVSNACENRSSLAHKLRDTLANALLSLSLAAVLVMQQPSTAYGDTSTSMPPPSTASTASTASQTASRTVVNAVAGENSVLNEENTPDNRQGSDQQQKDDKTSPVGDISEVTFVD